MDLWGGAQSLPHWKAPRDDFDFAMGGRFGIDFVKAPQRKTVSRLYAMSGNLCAYPECPTEIFSNNANLGEICHISAHNVGGPRYDEAQSDADRHGYDNLILLCRNHHKQVDDLPETFTREILLAMKRDHEGRRGRPEEDGDLFIAKRLSDDLERRLDRPNNLVVFAEKGSQVTVNTKSLKMVKAPLEDSIAAHPDAYRYTRYLIDRYHAYKKADRTNSGPLKYQLIYAAIKREFRAAWSDIPAEKFPALCVYMQRRIDGTILGRNRKAQGEANYKSWEEYRTL